MPGLPTEPGGSPSRCELGRLDDPAEPGLLFHTLSWKEGTFWGLWAVASLSGGISSQPDVSRGPRASGKAGLRAERPATSAFSSSWTISAWTLSACPLSYELDPPTLKEG